MPQLEILELGRNKIKALPTNPGTLVNLKVFSISKNKLTKIPTYIHLFKNLKIFKIDGNPIKWPNQSILSSLNKQAQNVVLNDNDHNKFNEHDKLDFQMECWVKCLQSYLRDNISINFTTDEESDHYHSKFSPLIKNDIKQFKFPINNDHHHLNNYHHHRNASSSAILPNPNFNSNQNIKSKKSLPDLRNSNRIITDPTPLRNFNIDESNILQSKVNDDNEISIDGINNNEINNNGNDSYDMNNNNNKIIDDHANDTDINQKSFNHFKTLTNFNSNYNSIFKHKHTPTPPSPLSISNNDVLIEAANSLLFALSQTHSAIQNLINLTSLQFISLIQPLLNNASEGLEPLFKVLDSTINHFKSNFDLIKLIEAIKTSSFSFSPLISNFRKILNDKQSSLELQYIHPILLRSTILSLYSSMSEIANAWRIISPILPFKMPNNNNNNNVNNVNSGGNGNEKSSIDKSTKKIYRQGLSLTQHDFNYLNNNYDQQDSLPYLSSAKSTPVKNNSNDNHDIENLRLNAATPTNNNINDNDNNNTNDLLNLIQSCIDLSINFWPLLDQDLNVTYFNDFNVVNNASDPIIIELRDKIKCVRVISDKLNQSLQSVKKSTLKGSTQSERKCLFDEASQFNKMVIWMASLVKGLGDMKRLPLKSRRRMQQIMDLVSELTVQLHVSQFRPTAPSPNSAALNMTNASNQSITNSPKSITSKSTNNKKSKTFGNFPTPVLSRSQSSQPNYVNAKGLRPVQQQRSATNFGAGLSRVFSPISSSSNNNNNNSNEDIEFKLDKDKKKRAGSLSSLYSSNGGYSASSDSTNHD